MIGNHFSYREVRCIDCLVIANYAFHDEHDLLFSQFSNTGEGGTFESGMFQDALLDVRENFPKMCNRCTCLVVKIISLPTDSPEWQEAWNDYHRITH